MSSSEAVLTSFTYADNKPYVVSRKSIESSVKVLKDLVEKSDEPQTSEPPKEDWDEEEEEEEREQNEDKRGEHNEDKRRERNEDKRREEVGQENIKTDLGNEEDDIEWSGDEAELSREVSILEQSMTSKRGHSPTKSPRKKKPY